MDNTSQRGVLSSRSVALRPPSDAFIDALFQLACTGEVSWNWNSNRETPDGFNQSLSEELLVMFSVVDRKNGQEIGLVAAHKYHPLHRFVVASVTLLPKYHKRVWPLEAGVLFVNHLFIRFDLRKVYGRVVEHQFAAIESGAGQYFEVEACLKDHLVVNGQLQNLYITSISAAQWQQAGRQLLNRIAEPSRSQPGGQMPPSRESTRSVLIEALGAVVDTDGEPLTDETSLVDLGFDSLDLASMLFEIEDRFDRAVPSDVLDMIAELGDDMTVAGVSDVLYKWLCVAPATGFAEFEPIVIDATTAE